MKRYITKFVRHIRKTALFQIFTLIGVGATILLTNWLPVVNDLFDLKKNISEVVRSNIVISHAFPIKSDRNTIHILIPRFELYSNDKLSKNDCIGYAIDQRIRQIYYKTKLPIYSSYQDSIKSPQGPEEAKELLKRHNADIIIYGLFKSKDNSCGNGSICFRTDANSSLKVIEDSININLEKYPLEFKDILEGQIEKGQFSMDTLDFDNWVQSLYIYKTNKRFYNQYTLLSKNKKFNSLSIAEKINRVRDRAYINYNIGNYYDAIIFCDSSLKLISDHITANNKKFYNNYMPINIASEYCKEYSNLNPIAFDIFYVSLLSYTNTGDYKSAISLIDKEIDRMNRYKNQGIMENNDKQTLDGVNMSFRAAKVLAIRGAKRINIPRPDMLHKGDKIMMKALFQIDINSYPLRYKIDLFNLKAYILIFHKKNYESAAKYLNEIYENYLTKGYYFKDCNFFFIAAMHLMYHRKDKEQLETLAEMANELNCSESGKVIAYKNYLLSIWPKAEIKKSYIYWISLIIVLLWIDSILFSSDINKKFIEIIRNL